jgi:serine/threonine-protein kinase
VCPVTGKPIRKERLRRAVSDVPSHADAKPIPLVSPRHAKESSSAPPPHREEHGLIGRVIGDKYRVTDLIGEGGMGTVYGAEHLEIGRRVAIKVLNRAHLGRREAVARFHQEARAAGTIGHPNICEIYDVGRLSDGAPYLVMERLTGQTLADRINIEGALPFEDVISTLKQVLSALVAAHAKGIIHRDIKPENVFLTERVGCAPVAKILDFGISKSSDDSGDLSLTRTGMVMGTPFYMAPEQARGEHVDHRVDIYACGIMLYETLTGRRPFVASSYNALVLQILSTQPRDPREIRPAIPNSLVPIIYKALSKFRAERYDDARQFIDALTAVEAQLARSPTNAEIKRLAEEVRRSTQPPARLASDVPPSDALDIPVHFSDTGTGQQPVTLGTGEVEVNLDTGPRAVEEDPTMVGDQVSFGLGVIVPDAPPAGEEEVHDTIVDPSGAMLGELWAQLGRASSRAEATARTPALDASAADRIIDSVEDPDGGATEDEGGGRYSKISSFPQSDGPPREERVHPLHGGRPVDPKARSRKAPRALPRPSAPKRPRIPSEPDELDDDAVTSLYVASEDGPKEVRKPASSPNIPKPPRPPRM